MRKQISINETSVGTLPRGLDVLELFASAGSELSQKEISEALGLPMPTVHRLVAVLTDRGWLDRDPVTRRLRLGLGLARLIPALLAGMRLPELARPHVVRLAATVRETVNLAILEGGHVVYLLSETGDRLLAPRVAVGLRLPAHCTALGKCLLAQLPDDLARLALGEEPYERRTGRTRTAFRQLHTDLESIRASGVAVSEEEYEVGLVSIAVPVTWLGRVGAAALNVSLPAARATPAFRAQLTDSLRQTVRAIDAQPAAAA